MLNFDVVDHNLAARRLLCGDDYTVADMANFAWYGVMVTGNFDQARQSLDVTSYTYVVRWAREIMALLGVCAASVSAGRGGWKIRGDHGEPQRHRSGRMSTGLAGIICYSATTNEY